MLHLSSCRPRGPRPARGRDLHPTACLALCVLALTAGLAATSSASANPVPAAFMSGFDDKVVITPHGHGILPAHFVKMIGAGEDLLGGGETMKVGFAFSLWYMRFTRGKLHGFTYDPLYSPDNATLAGPPDLTDISQLPSEIRDNMDPAFGIGRLPRLVAFLEWARYMDVPFVVHLNGGPILGEGWPHVHSASLYLEQQAQEPWGWVHCQWNEEDLVDPDDDPSTLDSPEENKEGSFAVLTVASDDVAADMGINLLHRRYKRRNLQAAVNGLLTYASLPRYAGRLAALSTDSDTRMNDFYSADLEKRWYADYNPIAIRQFQLWLEDHYGDETPLEDSNGDGATFIGDYADEYLTSGSVSHPHNRPPAAWTDVDPPRNPNTDLNDPNEETDRYWMLWTNYRTELIDAWLEEVTGWILDCGVPRDRLFGHEPSLGGAMFKNRVAPVDPPKDEAIDARCLERDLASLGTMHYTPFNAYDGYYFFDTYHRVCPNWGLFEWNPYVIVPDQQYAEPWQVQANVQAAYENGIHAACPHAFGSTSRPVVSWAEDNFADGDLDGWTPGGDLVHDSGVEFYTIGNDPMLFSPIYTDLAAEDVNLVVVRMRTPPGGTTVQLFFQRSTDPGFSSDRVVSLPLKNFSVAGPGWVDYTFVVQDHPLWNGQIKRLRLDPVNADVGELRINYISRVGPNPFSEALKSLVATYDGVPRPDMTPPAAQIPAGFVYLDDYITNPCFQVYGTGQDGDFDPAGDFESAVVTCGGVTQQRAILAPPPDKLGQWLVGTYQLQLPSQPLKLIFKIGLADGLPATNEGVRFEVTLRDAMGRLWDLADLEWREHAWSDKITIDLRQFVDQEVTLALRTHAIADAVGDHAAWGNPRLVHEFTGQPLSMPLSGPRGLDLGVRQGPGAQPTIDLSIGADLAHHRSELTIYNVTGQLVRRLVRSDLPAGTHSLVWDGRSNTGGRVPAGVYLVKAVCGDKRADGRVVLVR